jgi:hypothetical protein
MASAAIDAPATTADAVPAWVARWLDSGVVPPANPWSIRL